MDASEKKARVGWGNFRREHWELIWADCSTQLLMEGWSGTLYEIVEQTPLIAICATDFKLMCKYKYC